MPTLRLDEISRACQGELVRGDGERTVDSFAIDTRALRPGGMFFALPGSRADGHDYLAEAARCGAVAACVRDDRSIVVEAPETLIRVKDTVSALGNCGKLARDKLPDTHWTAITGSNGKTNTKELLAAGLAATRRVHRTSGNFNNHLGVPLTLLACPDDAESAVVELGMSAPGEIAYLATMVRPDVGLVTNVRAVHLEFFDSLDDIAAAKGELFAVLDPEAISVVNLDDLHVRVQGARHEGPRVTFGCSPEADLHVEEIANRFLPGGAIAFTYQGRMHTARLRIGGGHAALNALAALAAIVAAGEEIEPAIEKMQQLEAEAGRGIVHRLARGIVVVDDTYNSSPAALASVLETLHNSHSDGRKVLVMGDMLELGHVEDALHREAGKLAATSGVNLLVAVGPLSRLTAEAARRAGVEQVHHHADAAGAAEAVVDLLRDGDLVVIKGSRKLRLEHIVEALTASLREAG